MPLHNTSTDSYKRADFPDRPTPNVGWNTLIHLNTGVLFLSPIPVHFSLFLYPRGCGHACNITGMSKDCKDTVNTFILKTQMTGTWENGVQRSHKDSFTLPYLVAADFVRMREEWEWGTFHLRPFFLWSLRGIKNRNVFIPDNQLNKISWHHVGKVRGWLAVVVISVQLGQLNYNMVRTQEDRLLQARLLPWQHLNMGK